MRCLSPQMFYLFWLETHVRYEQCCGVMPGKQVLLGNYKKCLPFYSANSEAYAHTGLYWTEVMQKQPDRRGGSNLSVQPILSKFIFPEWLALCFGSFEAKSRRNLTFWMTFFRLEGHQAEVLQASHAGRGSAQWHGFTQLKLVACIFFSYPKQCRHLLLSKRATLVSNLVIGWQHY